MKITMKTSVDSSYETVVGGFNRRLLEYLLPGWCFARILRYEGEQHGDIVHLNFGLPGISDWKFVVKDAGMTKKLHWLIHRGLLMPPGLAFWQDMKRVVSLGKDKSAIVFTFEFHCKWKIFNPFIFSILFVILTVFRFKLKRYYSILAKYT